MWRPAEQLVIDGEDRRLLETWTRAHSAPQSVVMRCQVILLAADGLANSAIAKALGISRPTVLLWRTRFATGGPQALVDVAPGRGRPRTITAAKVKRIVAATTQTTPVAATHWSCRTLARAQGVSPATVQRIWDAHGLQPDRTRTFKLSRDKRFVEKLTDVVGLYLHPPDKAIVLSWSAILNPALVGYNVYRRETGRASDANVLMNASPILITSAYCWLLST